MFAVVLQFADGIADVLGREVLRSAGIPGPGPDRHLSPEIEAAVGLVSSGAVLTAVEEVIGELA